MAMTKAEMEAFKKKNFDKNQKVTKVQLDKLRKEGTPAKAIAKYKNDPAMREALNRFYGKDKVTAAGGSTSKINAPKGPGSGGENSGPGSSSGTRGGPGAKPRPPRSATATNKPVTNPGKGNTPYKPSSGKKVNVTATGVAVAGAAGLAALKATRGGPGAKPRRGITQGLKQIESGPKGKATQKSAQIISQAKSTAAAKVKAGVKSSNTHKMTDRPSNSGKTAMSTAGRHKAVKTGTANKMKAQGSKMMSSATSRYNSRSKVK